MSPELHGFGLIVFYRLWPTSVGLGLLWLRLGLGLRLRVLGVSHGDHLPSLN